MDRIVKGMGWDADVLGVRADGWGVVGVIVGFCVGNPSGDG